MFTITVTDKHGILRCGRVRRLTPRECWRLQGFTDEQFDKVIAEGIKDGQLYKMAGNAVSVPVITAIGEFIKNNYERTKEVANA
jgi:DNA (cytosine-5)-methyltransferase 1